MRKIFYILIPIGILLSSFKKGLPNPENKTLEISSVANVSTMAPETEQRLLERVKIIKEFISKNPKYNTELAFFIDMRVMSGKNRFIVYNLKNDSIVDQGLVAHGIGSETDNKPELKFSNNNSSFCTALGKYSIGSNYMGQYGKSYKLYGLEPTNSNAFARSIVLHKYHQVPYEEQNRPICHSMGCPMLNEIYYTRIEKLIDNSKRNIILDIYY
ncbi:murein L,D-transpeptidase catalytic domain-containing protein [Flavobacterium soyangense]|uniref:Murein L,D-transpeptidase catalytic domain family protein n=1 Tax=Flavobacterium soyangense TaxID=2023265 RepID=A0A930UAS0_9FLAO|nr:murein L,D-transpeptidase catalytic domain family protein [Flavobacterium soyangense]MBF2708605.1 murein L,D-transpeptidase catalytic domain family protein [Flavobacterium soyangense]